ncbi:MAG: hypothetical protein AB8B91_23495 [Rubripirellula sp.]
MSSVQLDQATQNVLTEFASRRRLLLMLRTIAVGIVFFVGCMTLVAGCDYLWLLSDGVRWFLSVSAYAATAGAMWWFGGRHFGSGDARDVARRLETADPGLREDLLSAVELADPRVANGSEGFRGWLQQRVGRRTAKINVGRLLPIGLIKRWLSTGLVILFVCLSMLLIPKMQFGRRMARAMLPVVPIERASLTKVTIVHPSPASGYVAEGDAIGVIVEVAGRPARDVVMEWRTRDGMEGESMMTPRIVPPSENTAQSDFNDGTIAVQNRFAANLSVATEPVEYRIIAGDAITLWHELTPLPRPRVESFVKRYVFPNYARLEDRTEEAEHGDLNAFVGTMAEVTVRFDQRVQDATLRFGNRGVTRDMEAVPGSDREFIVNIPIKTPAHYQVDATSADSGLNNPFSPQYSISPIIDTPPIVRWSPTMRRTSILSPLDVIHLLGTAVDDLPMEQIVQEFQVNAEPVVRRRIPVTESGRELAIDSDWDLMHRAGEEESHKLSGGDIVRTRLVAIDRRGHRGESDFIEILIAEEGFDKDRHQRLDELKSLTTKLALWAEQVKVAMTPLQKSIEKEEPELFESAKPAALQIHEQRT